VTQPQSTVPCPRCGSTAQVHSITELADLARMRLGQMQPGNPGVPPQAGPQQGWAAEPQAGPPPGSPGYSGVPGPGPMPGPMPGFRPGRRRMGYDQGPVADSIGDALGDVLGEAAAGMAAQFIGRAIRRRVQRTVEQRVMPTLAAAHQDSFREQIAIAERYPELCACFTDKVVFLSGGTRTQPLPNLGTITLQQADILVAQLRAG
jgi:hypothetical protein